MTIYNSQMMRDYGAFHMYYARKTRTSDSFGRRVLYYFGPSDKT